MVIGDHDGVMACVDETASSVFTSLCRLSGGDVERALDLTIDTYRYLERVAVAAGGVDVDRDWMTAAAHSVFAADPHDPPTAAAEPIAGLSTGERVVISLRTIEGWDIADIADLLGVDIATADATLASGTRALGAIPAETALHAVEVWFDDVMRSDVRAAVAKGTGRPARRPGTGRSTADAWLPDSRSPDSRSPDPRSPDAPTVDPARPRRSRRITMGALAAAAVAIGALAVWVRPSGSDRGDAATTTERRTATTEPASSDTSRPPETTTPFTVDPSGAAGIPSSDAPTTTAPPPLTGYVVDALPAGFQAGGGYADGRDSVGRRNWFELWSSPDATHTTGRWFGVVVVDDALTLPSPEPAAGAQRVDIGGRPALARVAADGVLSLTVQLPGRQHVELRSFGFSTDELVALAGAIDVGESNRPSYAASVGTLFDGLEVRVSEPTNQPSLGLQAFNRLETTSFYLSADGTESITVNTGSQAPNDLLASRLLNPGLVGPAAAFAPGGIVVIDGTPRITGTVAETGAQPYSFVQWHVQDITVTVLGNVPPEQLFDVARTTRPATAGEWVAQSRAEPVFTNSTSSPPFDADAPIEISSNSTDLGPTWTVSITRSAQRLTLVLGERRPTDPASTSSAPFDESETWLQLEPDPANPVLEYDTLDATIVVVLLDAPPASSKVRLTVDGSAPQIMGLTPITGTSLFAAAYAFSENVHYAVDLVDVSGSRLISTLRP